MEQYLKTVDGDWYKPRLGVATLIVFAVFVLLISRLFYLQVIEGSEYRHLSENNCIRLKKIKATRGLIFDRNGLLLVDNRPSFNLGLIRKDVVSIDDTVQKLARVTGIPVEEILAELERQKGIPAFKPIWIKQDIGRDLLAAVEVHRFELPGVFVEIQARRQYMHGNAAHIIGYLGEISPTELKSGKFGDALGGDFIGKSGIEHIAEDVLRGTSGGQQVEVDARGKVIKVLQRVDPVPGDNIYLTIRYDLQTTAASLLKEKVGAVVALDAATGDVIAMASSPDFDQNAFINGLTPDVWQSIVENPFHPLENKAVRGTYPPASTYKIVTAMAAIEEGVVQPGTKIFCPGYYHFGDRTFRCWKHSGHGWVDMEEALGGSCDVYFYQAGLKLGVDRIAAYARRCGLGARTGIELVDEEKGLIPTSEWKRRRFKRPWQKGETLSVSIGQGYNLTTPLQMAVLIGAVGNGGLLYRPGIIHRIVSHDGVQREISTRDAGRRLPCKPETLNLIHKGLWQVVNGKHGTAPLAKVEGIEVIGKTGTAQVFSRKRNEARQKREIADHLKPHAWFVAHAQKGEEQIAIAVLIENGEKGSTAAAPIARDLIKAYFGIEAAADSGGRTSTILAQ